MRAAVLLPFDLWLMKLVLMWLTSCVEPPYYKAFPRNTISNIYILRVQAGLGFYFFNNLVRDATHSQ
jgi:hypothetical protein